MSQKLTPELAGKVLRADLKNIIDKVGAGRPLSGVERDLFATLKLTTEDIGKRRQLALLGKWSNGKRLNKAEMAEIEELLPEGAVKTEVEPEKKIGRNGYYHTYPQHVEWYGSSLRTIKRWVDEGKKCGETCPLDDPEALYSWLSRHHQRAVPEGVLQALIEWRKKHGVVVAPEPVAEEEVPDSSEPDDDKRAEMLSLPVGEDETGLAAALSRLEVMEVRLSRLATEPGGAKPWLDTISRMTSVSTKLREEMEKLGQLLPKEMVEGIFIELLQPIEQGVRGLYSTMCSVTGVVACPQSEEKWHKECDRFFVRIRKGFLDEV